MAELRYETPSAHDAAAYGALMAGMLREFRCTACSYGASCRIAPERCPMCGGGSWELAPEKVV